MELIDRNLQLIFIGLREKKKSNEDQVYFKHHPFQLGKHIFTVILILFLLNTECGKSFMPYCLLYSPIWLLFGFVFYVCIFFNIFEGVIFAEIKFAGSTICSWSYCSSVLSDLMSWMYSFMSTINQINKQCLSVQFCRGRSSFKIYLKTCLSYWAITAKY